MSLQPLAETLRFPVYKQVNGPSVLVVDNNTPIGHTLAPCPVINAYFPDFRVGRGPHSMQVTQDSRGTDIYAHASKQPAGRSRGHGYALTGHKPLAPTSTPAITEHLTAGLLCKSLPMAFLVMAEELARLKS